MVTKIIRMAGILLIVLFSAVSIFFALAERDLAPTESTLKTITSYPSFFEDRFYDIRMSQNLKEDANDDRIILAMIDEYTLEKVGRFPFTRTVWADFMNKMSAFSPKVVSFDVFFVEPELQCNDVSPDDVFAKAIENYQASGERKVVLPYSLSFAVGENITHREFKSIPDDLYNFMTSAQVVSGNSLKQMSVSKNAYPIDTLVKTNVGLGHIQATEDADGIYRHYYLIGNVDDVYFQSFSLLTYQYFTGDQAKLIKNSAGEAILKLRNGDVRVNQNGQSKLRWLGGPEAFPRVSIRDILEAPDDDPEMIKLFKDKIVFVGSTAYGAHDLRHTPVDAQLPGVYLHMNILHMLLEGKFFKSLEDSTLISWWILLAGTLVMIIIQLFGRPMFDAIAVFVLTLGIYITDTYWLVPAGYEIKLFFCLFSIVAAYSWNTFLNFHLSNKDRAFLKGAFENYISPELIDEMYEKGEPPKLGGDSNILTAFFTDIQSFSTFSEQLKPAELVILLNEYLTAMTDILLDERGTLDKYEGDAIIAFFGAPLKLPDHAQRSCRVAALMQMRLAELRENWSKGEKQWPDIISNMMMRVGINSGEIVTGNMGSQQRMNYTMMGDSVNLAARLEEAAKQYGIYIQLSHFTFELLDDPEEFIIREIDTIRVVGKKEPVTTYEIICLNLEVPEEINNLVEIFNEGITFYKKMKWTEALTKFKESLNLEYVRFGEKIKTSTSPSEVYIKRCEEYLQNPPPENWDGVFVLTKK